MKYAMLTLIFLSGKVMKLDIAGPGTIQVNIAGVGDGNTLCALNRKMGEYEPEACKGVLSMLLAAKISGTPVRISFRNDSNTACNKGDWKDFSKEEHGFYYLRLEG
jgi:hypothetical protein